MLGCGTALQVVLARKGFCWPVPTPVWLLCLPSCVLCALSSPQSLLHTRTELRCDARVEAGPGCADLSRSPGLPWRCLPATPHQLHAHFTAGIFGMVLFHYFLDFPLVRLDFSGMRRSCCGCIECWFWGISNSQKGACSSGYAHFKMCVYEFKVTNFFCLGVLFLDSFFFPQISPVMSWSFDSPPDKIVPVREAVLWDSFWKLFREITVGFLRNLVRAWKDHRKVFFP